MNIVGVIPYVNLGNASGWMKSLGGYCPLRQRARAADSGQTVPSHKSVILLWMAGGPSHIDTWDPKPDRPLQNRGPFSAIATRLPGIFLRGILATTVVYLLMSAVAFGTLPGERLGRSAAPMAEVGAVYLPLDPGLPPARLAPGVRLAAACQLGDAPWRHRTH